MKKTHYAVKVGRNQGIYRSWEECQVQVEGFPRAKFKGFSSYSEAEKWLLGGVTHKPAKKPRKPKGTKNYPMFNPHVVRMGNGNQHLYSGSRPPWDFPGEFIRCCDSEWLEPINRNAPAYQREGL
jgi:hypothetical protein